MTAPIALSGSRYLVRRRSAPLGARLPAPALGGYAPEHVAFAARAWTMKAEEEHFSAAIFADALSYLVDAEVPIDLLSGLHRVVGDELRHVELCLDVARRIEAPAPGARQLQRELVPTKPAERRARGRSILLVEGAIGETLSSALFAAGRRGAEEPCIRAALGSILRDEVLHARFFWEALAALEPDAQAREALHREASLALGRIETAYILPVLRRLEQGAPFEPAWAAIGVIPPELRVETYYRAIEGRVIQGLDRLGLDGGTAWANRYRGSSTGE